jgi:hypothetical protein
MESGIKKGDKPAIDLKTAIHNWIQEQLDI